MKWWGGWEWLGPVPKKVHLPTITRPPAFFSFIIASFVLQISRIQKSPLHSFYGLDSGAYRPLHNLRYAASSQRSTPPQLALHQPSTFHAGGRTFQLVMRIKAVSAALASALAAVFILQTASATPFDTLSSSTAPATTADAFTSNNGTLEKRCENPCGWQGWLCCAVGQTCSTDGNNQAVCLDGTSVQVGSGGYWQTYTKTWVETGLVTMTSIYSVYVGATPAAAPATPTWNQATQTPYATNAPLQCNWSGGESSCGSICCSSGQYCQVSGQCAPAAASVSTGTYSAPLRPTASTLVIQTATMATTTTVPFIAPVATGQSEPLTTINQSSGGLSGGAIAGIVIGVIAGLILLFFLIICLCFKGIWDGLVALFGGGKRDRRRKETVEYYSHHGREGRTWYGDRPARIERSQSPKRKGIGALGIAGILGAIAIALGIRRRVEKRRDEKSDYSSDYYTETYSGTSRSE